MGPGGRFRVGALLGAGGMGVVYEAYDEELGVRVALKRLKHVGGAALERLTREFRALAGLVHPNLVRLYDLYAPEGDVPFMTMELVEGVDLIAGVHRSASTVQARCGPHDTVTATFSGHEPPARGAPGGPASPAVGLIVDQTGLRAGLRQLAAAVSALHASGRLHRDLKPSNTLVTREGRLVVLDFGLTIAADAATDELAGTPAYMAPELAAGGAPSPASDWYSVGVILYQALTGTLPFAGTRAQLALQKRRFRPDLPAGVAVPADLLELCLRLLDLEPGGRPTGAEVLARLGPAQAAPGPPVRDHGPGGAETFVGRRALLAQLHGAVARAGQGRAALVSVVGAAAAGKSALVRRFLDQLSAQTAVLAFAGCCYEREWIPFKAFDGVVRQIARWLHQRPRDELAAARIELAALGVLFPGLPGVDPGSVLAGAPAPDSQELRARSFAAFRTLLGELAVRRAVVLWIDDLQWADADSLALLRALLDPPIAGVVLVASERAQPDASERSALLGGAAGSDPPAGLVVEAVNVGPLPPDETLALAGRLLVTAPAALRQRCAALAVESGGNPLFLMELCRYGVANADELAATGRSLSLEEVVRARVAGLPDDARRLLELVAIAGRPIPEGVAAQAAELPEDWPRASIELALLRLVRGVGARQLAPYHDRIREIVSADLPEARKRGHHGRLARALEHHGRSEPELLVEHYRAAGEPARAGALARAAARRAAEALAFDRAAAFCQVALDLLPATAAAGERRQLDQSLAAALAGAGRGAEAAAAYLRAAQGVDEGRAGRLRTQAAEQLLRAGHIDRATAAMRQVLRSVGLRFPRTPALAMLSLLLWSAALRVRGLWFRRRAERDIPALQLDRVDITHSVALGLALVDVIRGAAFHRRCLWLSLQAGEPFRALRALVSEVVHLAASGRRRARTTARLTARVQRLAVEVGTPYATAGVALARGMAAAFEERWGDALAFMTESVALLRDCCAGVAWEISTAELFRMRALFMLGRLGELMQAVPGLLREAEARGNVYLATDLRLGTLNSVWLFEGDPDRAEREAGVAAAAWARGSTHVQDFLAMQSLCNVDLYRGRPERAFARVALGWRALARSHLFQVQLIRSQSHLMRARAAVALAVAEGGGRASLARARGHETAMGVARAALARAQRERVPAVTGQVAMLRAGLALHAGDRGAAVGLLVAAASVFEAEQLRLLAATTNLALARVAGGAVARAGGQAAERYFAAQPIRHPARVASFIAPGLPS